MTLKEITKEYNNAIKKFKFHTVSATESGIASILRMYPEIEKLPKDEMIEQIAIIISDLAFN